MKKIIESAEKIGFLIMVGVMIVRSGVHIQRIINEREVTPQVIFPEIKACSLFKTKKEGFEWLVYSYRNLGITCRK